MSESPPRPSSGTARVPTAAARANLAASAPPRPPLIRASDIAKLAALVPLGVLAWALPARAWRRAARAVTWPTRQRLSPRRIAPNRVEKYLHVLGSYRPGGWNPQVEVVGTEHIDAALEQRTGVILWVYPFLASTLPVKIGLASRGYSVSHLSRPAHGFSSSRFGIRVLNPLVTNIELRELRERVVIDPRKGFAGHRALRRRLAENGIVSILALDIAVQAIAVQRRSGELTLATGPITLARSAGAPLLPVFPLRTGSDAYRIVIDEAIPVEAGATRGRSIELAAEEFAGRLTRVLDARSEVA